MATLPNIGIARIRMPIDDRPSPGNLINKLVSFKKIVDVENSVTVVPEMIKVFRQLFGEKGDRYFSCHQPRLH